MVLTSEVPSNLEQNAIIGAAEGGAAWAQNWLGVKYWKGEHVPQDFAAAANWLRKAAEQGDKHAQANLAQFYSDGVGVEENEAEAERWCRKAAEQGQSEAQMLLGYLLGKGGDFNQAVFWYRRSAEQGNSVAQNNLGVSCMEGKGVPKDYIEAYRWLNLAASQGIEHAVEAREAIAKKMTRDQVAEGQRRSAEFVPRTESGAQLAGQNSEEFPVEPHDFTDRIERLEAFEDRLGTRLEALYATCFLGSGDNVPWLRVCGELHAANGTGIQAQLKVVVDAYDSDGRLLNSGWQSLSEPEKFLGFETFSIQINAAGKVAKVRIYPKPV